MKEILKKLRTDKPRRSMQFVSTADDVLSVQNADTVYICGQAVFLSLASTGQTPHTDQYIEQPPRPISSRILTDKKEDVLRVWVSKDMLEASEHLKRHPKLAIDQYLHWGFKQKTDTVLICGNENDKNTDLEILVFRGGKLIHVQERSLHPRNYRDFQSQLDLALSDITNDFRGFALVVALPIGPLNEYPCARLCQNVDDEPFRRQINVSLNYGKRSGQTTRFLLPAFMVVASIVAYGATVGYAWNSYNSAITEYRSAIQGVQNFDESMLKVLEARRAFLGAEQSQIQTVNNAKRIATAIAGVDRVHVRKLFIKDANSTSIMELSPDSDFGVVAEIPLESDAAGLEQARPVLDQLAAATESKLREIRQDVVTDQKSGQKRLVMTFEGKTHG